MTTNEGLGDGGLSEMDRIEQRLPDTETLVDPASLKRLVIMPTVGANYPRASEEEPDRSDWPTFAPAVGDPHQVIAESTETQVEEVLANDKVVDIANGGVITVQTVLGSLTVGSQVFDDENIFSVRVALKPGTEFWPTIGYYGEGLKEDEDCEPEIPEGKLVRTTFGDIEIWCDGNDIDCNIFLEHGAHLMMRMSAWTEEEAAEAAAFAESEAAAEDDDETEAAETTEDTAIETNAAAS